MKKILICILTAAFLLTVCLTGCNNGDGVQNDAPSNDPTDGTSSVESERPTTDDELYKYIIGQWTAGEYERLYPYADATLTSLLDEAAFVRMFSSISYMGGALLSDSSSAVDHDGGKIYYATLDFENITVDLTVALKDVKIGGFLSNTHFKGEFEIARDGYTERYFVLNSNGYELNAVYTYVSDGESHPSALIIGGSGPTDYNGTVGLLTPLGDMARSLAGQGVNSLRIDKRTLNYGYAFDADDTIEEEYLADCAVAIDYLKMQSETDSISLIGHSLGGQIATVIASERDDIASMILWNSTARNLADVMCDQYSALDAANADTYRTYAEIVKALTDDNTIGLYYFGASDRYWLELNKVDVIANIQKAGVPTLIVNSRKDAQLYDEDIALWQAAFEDFDNVKLRVDDRMSHFGYDLDMSAAGSAYKAAEMPTRLIDLFTGFIIE